MNTSKQCLVLGVETVIDMLLLAEISSGDAQPKFSGGAPSDVLRKLPELTGSMGSTGYLRMRYRKDVMDCVDGTTYHCKVYYKPTIGETTQANVTATLSVLVFQLGYQ